MAGFYVYVCQSNCMYVYVCKGMYVCSCLAFNASGCKVGSGVFSIIIYNM